MTSVEQHSAGQQQAYGPGEMEMYLGQNSRLTGVLKVQGMMQIDGTVEGEVLGSALMQVGKTGKVEATVRASQIISQGPIRGDIVANKKIQLMAPATLEGQIDTPVFLLEEGVRVNGTLKMPHSSPPVS